MSKKLAIKSVYDQLQTVQVTTLDGEARTLNVMLWTGARDEETDITPYTKPACFLETTFSDGVPVGAGATSYDIVFRVMIEQEQYNTEGDIDMELSLLDLPDNVHRVLNQFKPDNCAPLYQSGTQLDHTQGNTNFCVLEYSSHLVDLTASANDVDSGLYIERTLTSPVLQIDETVYVGAIPESGGGTTGSAGGAILPGLGATTTVWLNGAGVPSNTLGYNGDYYLDTLTGDIYWKQAGVFVYLMTISGGSGGSASGIVYAVTQGDADFSAENGTAHVIPNNVLTTTRRVDVSGLTTECEIINGEQGAKLLFIGAPVYSAGGAMVEVECMSGATTHLRKAEGKIIIIN